MQPQAPINDAFFFQANTIKGYEAWDKAGVIANHFADRFQQISYGPLGLLCNKPTDPEDALLEARVDPQIIHLSYRSASTWDAVIRETARQTEWVARAISVSTFSRVGLRVYLVWPVASQEEIVRIMRYLLPATQHLDWLSLGAIDPSEFSAQIDAGDLQARLVIRAAAKNRDSGAIAATGTGVEVSVQDAAAPPYALLFDLDLYQARSIAYVDVQAYLRRCRDYIADRIVPLGQHLMEIT